MWKVVNDFELEDGKGHVSPQGELCNQTYFSVSSQHEKKFWSDINVRYF